MPGDSLWALAADRLPAGTSAVVIDKSWRRLYERNRGVVGEDPDLLQPGTVLHLPPRL
jgi:nucleoid-associated protein YgaU